VAKLERRALELVKWDEEQAGTGPSLLALLASRGGATGDADAHLTPQLGAARVAEMERVATTSGGMYLPSLPGMRPGLRIISLSATSLQGGAPAGAACLHPRYPKHPWAAVLTAGGTCYATAAHKDASTALQFFKIKLLALHVVATALPVSAYQVGLAVGAFLDFLVLTAPLPVSAYQVGLEGGADGGKQAVPSTMDAVLDFLGFTAQKVSTVQMEDLLTEVDSNLGSVMLEPTRYTVARAMVESLVHAKMVALTLQFSSTTTVERAGAKVPSAPGAAAPGGIKKPRNRRGGKAAQGKAAAQPPPVAAGKAPKAPVAGAPAKVYYDRVVGGNPANPNPCHEHKNGGCTRVTCMFNHT
jgi:hypothetical protein